MLRLTIALVAHVGTLLMTASLAVSVNGQSHPVIQDAVAQDAVAQDNWAYDSWQTDGAQELGTPPLAACDGCSACSTECDAMYEDGCGCGCGDCNQHGGHSLLGVILQNLSLFGGLEGSKQPQDFGVNAHFGGRFHANMGLPLIADCGLGLQIGTATNYTDNAVQVIERIEGTSERFQSFTTVGLFQRTDCGLSWAVGYDYLYQDYYDNFNLGQWRGDVGYRWNRCNEIGTWFAISSQDDHGSFGAIPMVLDPITQGNVYWRRNWENDAQTTFWLGIAEGHGEANVALGDLPPVDERLVFGSDVFVPLSPKLALYGQANFITPADTGTVDAFLGIAFFPGGSHGARERQFAPRLSVANNTTFANDFAR